MARVDFFLERESAGARQRAQHAAGFTAISMYPKLWEASGVPLPRLLDELIRLALARKERRSRLSHNPGGAGLKRPEAPQGVRGTTRSPAELRRDREIATKRNPRDRLAGARIPPDLGLSRSDTTPRSSRCSPSLSRWVDLDARHPVDSTGEVPDACAGTGLLGHLVLALGLLGLFAPRPIAVILALLALVTMPAWRDLAWSARYLFRGRPPARVIAASALLLAPMLLLPLYPPTAFDATMYHLPYARAFVSTGAVPFLPALRFPFFLSCRGALRAAPLVSGDVAARAAGLLHARHRGLLFLWGRRVFSRRPAPGGSALPRQPARRLLSATAYADPALAFFSVAALHAFSRWRAAGQSRWLAAAGFFAGSAAATKYLGLFWAVLLGAAVLVARVPVSRRRAAAIFFVCALAAGLPWYVSIPPYGHPVSYLPSSSLDRVGLGASTAHGRSVRAARAASVALWPGTCFSP